LERGGGNVTIMLVCNKKHRKKCEGVLRGIAAHRLVDTVTVVKNGIAATIAEHNPHILVWENGVAFKKCADFRDIIVEIRTSCPKLRIIYVHENRDTSEFESVSSFLMDDGIYDIIGDFAKIADIIDKPMTFEDFQNSREILSEKENIITPEPVQIVQNSGVDIFAEYLRDDEFNFDKIVTISC
jgi:hypothetical protein